MTAPSPSLQITATPSGNLDSRYTDGDDGSGSLAWDAPASWPAFTNITVNTSFTSDISARLADPGSPSATLTVHPDYTLGTGWAFDGTNLTQTGTTAASGQVRFRATRLGAVVDSHIMNYSSIAAGSTDDVAPTKIVGLDVTLNGSNQPVISFESPCDPFVSGKDTDGLNDFRVTRDTTDLTDVAFSGVGLSLEYTETDVGTLSPAGTSTQTVADWQLTGEGNISSTADNFRFVHGTVSGDFTATVEVESFTNGTNDFAKAGIMARTDTSSGSAMVFARVHRSREVRLEYRAAAGQSRITIGSGQVSAFPCQLKLQREGNVWTVYSSEDDSVDTLVASLTEALPTTLEVGVVATSTEDGVAVTVEYNNLCVQNLGRQSVTDTGAGTDTTVAYKVTAFDNNANESTDSETVNITIPAAAPSTAIRWHPGHYYAVSDTNSSDQMESAAAWQSHAISNFAKANNSSKIRGNFTRILLGMVSSAPATFDWTTLDALVQWHTDNSKYIMLMPAYKHFQSANLPLVAPADLSSHIVPLLNSSGSRVGQVLAVWREEVMDRVIEIYEAIMARYNDTDAFEYLFNVESPLSLAQSTAQAEGYDVLTYSAQLQRLQDALAGERNFNTALNINSLGQQQAGLLMDRSHSLGLAMASPDARETTGQRIFRGEISTQSGGSGTDYRQAMAHASIMSFSAIGPSGQHDTIDDAMTYADSQDLTHVAWVTTATVTNTGAPSDEATIRAEIDSRPANSPLWTACPTNYPSCDTS